MITFKKALLLSLLLSNIEKTSFSRVDQPIYVGSYQVAEDVDKAFITKFLNEYNEIYKYREDYDYQKAYRHLNQAIIYASNIKNWEIRHSLNVLATTACLDVGVRFYDNGKYNEAILTFNQGLKLNPTFPMLYYEKSLALIKISREWDATVSLYDAYRLNSYPSYRSMIAPVNDEWSYKTDGKLLLENILKQLSALNKDREYPIAFNFRPLNGFPPGSTSAKVGHQLLLRLIPGIGGNFLATKENTSVSFNLYFNDHISKAINFWGKPSNIEELNELGIINYYFDNVVISVKNGNLISGIMVFDLGFHVLANDLLIFNGAPAKQIVDTFGKSNGYVKYTHNLDNLRESINYETFGLTFGINYRDVVSFISIRNLE